MKKIIGFAMAVLFAGQPLLFGQSPPAEISAADAARWVRQLSADSMKGRGNARPELLRAARLIGSEWKRLQLQPYPAHPSFYLPFRPFGGSRNQASDELTWNGKKLLPDAFRFYHTLPGSYSTFSLSDFQVVRIDSAFSSRSMLEHLPSEKPLLLWTSRPQPDLENYFPPELQFPAAGLQFPVLLVCASEAPVSASLRPLMAYYTNAEYNVVAMLPGLSKPDEYVVISAHYDHEGVYQHGRKKDSILNGANDNASGTAALLLLAEWYSRHRSNERTLVFCAFAGEELGLLGSRDFVKLADPARIKAVINIEMIGIPQYGRQQFFITGYGQSSLPAILDRELSASGIRFNTGPPDSKELFSRSDNFPFVELGIAAHTIMSSDDDELCYHQPCDEAKRIDFDHLAFVCNAILQATKPLIAGTVTPTGVRR